MKARQHVCFRFSGNWSSRGQSECALLLRTDALHEIDEAFPPCDITSESNS
jgi:hypothetical protein